MLRSPRTVSEFSSVDRLRGTTALGGTRTDSLLDKKSFRGCTVDGFVVCGPVAVAVTPPRCLVEVAVLVDCALWAARTRCDFGEPLLSRKLREAIAAGGRDDDSIPAGDRSNESSSVPGLSISLTSRV